MSKFNTLIQKKVMNKYIKVLAKYKVNRLKFEKSVEVHNDQEILKKIKSLMLYNFDLKDSMGLSAKLDIGKKVCLEMIENYLELHQKMKQEDLWKFSTNAAMAIIEDKVKEKFGM